MNPATEISPSTQLILDEIRKLCDKFDARWAPAKQVCVQEASWDVLIPIPIQPTVVGADVVADKWGGLFHGGDDSDEQHREARSIVADNWGGLFEQPVHTTEERNLFPMDSEWAVSDDRDVGEVHIPLSELLSSTPDGLIADKVTSTDLDAPLDADQKLIRCGPIDIEYAPASKSLRPQKGVSIALDAGCAFPDALDAPLMREPRDVVEELCIGPLEQRDVWKGRGYGLTSTQPTAPVVAFDSGLGSTTVEAVSTDESSPDSAAALAKPNFPAWSTSCLHVPITSSARVFSTDLDSDARIRSPLVLVFVDAILTPDAGKEHASLGGRQVFEVLSLYPDIFCNFCIGFELLDHMSMGVDQHQPWPPPDELGLMTCDAGLRPLPWPSFNMVERCSVRCYTFSFGLDHNSGAMHVISDFFSGMISVIVAKGSIQDGFTQYIGAFLRVVLEEMQLDIECVANGVLLSATKSGGYRSPWPPPNQLDMLSDGVHRQPAPWPSCSCSANQGLMVSIHYEFSLKCWEDCIELLRNTTQVDWFNRKEKVDLFHSSQGFVLFLSEASKLKWMWPLFQTSWSLSLLLQHGGLTQFDSSNSLSHDFDISLWGLFAAMKPISYMVIVLPIFRHLSDNLVWGLGGKLYWCRFPGSFLLLSSICPLTKKHQLLGSNEGHYPYDLLLKHSPPGLLHLILVDVVLSLLQWPSFCHCEVGKSPRYCYSGFESWSKLYFQASGIFEMSDPMVACTIEAMNKLSATVSAAWGQAAFQEEVVTRVLTLGMESPAAEALIVKFLKEAFEEVSSAQSAQFVKSEPIVKNVTTPPPLPKDASRQLCKQELMKHTIIQLPWDPGGSILLYRLGGKPNFKERGMLATSHGWAVAWAMDLEPSPDIGRETTNAKGKQQEWDGTEYPK